MPYLCSVAAENESVKEFALTAYSDIGKLGASQWNKYVPEMNVLMQYENLQLLQTIQSSNMQFRYVLVKRDGITIGVMYFQIVTFHANQLINYFPEVRQGNVAMQIAKNLTEKILNAINVKLLVSGNVFMTGENGFYFSAEISKATRAKIVRRTVRQLLNDNPDIKATLISDLYAPKTEFDTDFRTYGYHQITVESDMSMLIKPEWKTFDDYLNTLSSKYRVRAKKVFALCDQAKVTMKDFSAEDIAQHEEQLYLLYKKVMIKADFKLAELDKNFFRQQKLQTPDNYFLHAYSKNEELIGFISAFKFGPRMEVHYTGMSHEVSKPIHLYQHMMYDMLKKGIEVGARQLHFGRTAPEIKSTIGAKPSPMYGYVKHFNPIINFLLVRNYTASLKPQNYIFRNPFKE